MRVLSSCVFALGVAMLVQPWATSPAWADVKTLEIPDVPTCPPGDGQDDPNFPKNKDKDGDGKKDRLYFRAVDKKGNDFEIWCLDHGETGDYAIYASSPGQADKKIARCAFICGLNEWTVEMDDKGNFTKYRGSNWDPREAPDGDGSDLEFYYDWETHQDKVVKTQDQHPRTVRTARLEGAPYDGDTLYATVDASAFDAFVDSVAGERGPTPIAGVGRGALVSIADFEAVTGQRLISVPMADGSSSDVVFYSTGFTVSGATLNAASNALQIQVAAVPNGGPLELAVVIPRGLIDSVGPHRRDTAFKVLADDTPVTPAGVASDTDRTLTFSLPGTTHVVRITGTVTGAEVVLPVVTSKVITAETPAAPAAQATPTAPLRRSISDATLMELIKRLPVTDLPTVQPHLELPIVPSD